MKKYLNPWLMAALVCGLGLCVASCNDDVSDEQKKAEEEAALEEKASNFWGIVGQLVSMNDYTEDFAGKTFEPIIGNEDPGDPQTRIVPTNTMEAAAASYGYLVGDRNITESTTSHEWSDPEVGTLTYRKVTDGTAWAEVTVDIPAVPHLTKIIYRSAEQGNTNGGVTNGGRAYYRFGDVISRTNADGKLEYWVCVRPAFDKADKGDTHWMSVSPVPKKNIWTYTGSNKVVYKLHDKLSYSEEHMKNMAEMLFAICYPTEWMENIINYGPSFFHDFKKETLKYHNSYFWKNVQNAWENKQIAEKVFGQDKGLSWFADNLKSKGLYLLYRDTKWNTLTTNGPKFYQGHFTNQPGTKFCNMRTPDDEAFTMPFHIVIDKKNHANDIEFNEETECTLEKPYIVKEKFFGDANPRWVVRHAYGKELSSTGKYANNQMPITGVTEVYRYYRDVNPCDNLDQEPEITPPSDGTPGDSYFHAGDIIQRKSDGTYWMCVRPAGGPQYKEDSYWICLHPFNKSGKTIIKSEEKECTMYYTDGKENPDYLEANTVFTFAKDLMSLETAKAAHLTFTSLVYPKAHALIPEAERTYNELKEAGFDLMKLHAYCIAPAAGAQYAESYTNKEGMFLFAYGNPVKDSGRTPVATSYVSPSASTDYIAYTDYVQPVMGTACNEVKNGKLQAYTDIRQNVTFKNKAVQLLLTPVNDYDELYLRHFSIVSYVYYASTLEEFKGYDFKDYLHHYASGRLSYQNDEYLYMHQSDARQVIFSPELVIKDNKTDNGRIVSPVSSSDYTEIYTGGALHAFDYWAAAKKFERIYNGVKEDIE